MQGFFNANSDLHFLVNLIDDLKNKYKDRIPKEEKEEKKEKKNNITKNEIKADDKPKKNKNQKSKINEEEDIMTLRRNNMPKIRNFLEEFLKEHKRSYSMKNLRPHSQTIASATTCEDSENIEDCNLNINQLVSINEIKEKKNKKSIKNNLIIDDILKIKDNNEKEAEFKRGIGRSKTITLLREMTPVYKEEDELEGLNIIFKEPGKKISFILVDLLIKKIIFENFMNNNILLIYHFCQQCFCFVNKEVFFRKLFHCYKFYKNKNISINNLKNLVEFINILVIEMFEYYQKVNYNEVYMNLIKKFYFELISDLITNFKEDEDNNKTDNNNKKDDENKNKIIENETESKGFRFESMEWYDCTIKDYGDNGYILNKKNLINLNLNTEIKNINIFILKEKETKTETEKKNKDEKSKDEKNKADKANKKSETTDKDVIRDFKEDKKNKTNLKNYNISRPDIRNTISFRENKLMASGKEENNGEENEEDNKKSQKLFHISKTLRKSQIIQFRPPASDIIIEEAEKEENSDEDEKTKKDKSDNIWNSGNNSEDSDEENKENGNKDEKEEENIEEINKIVDSIFLARTPTNKIVSEKEDILQQLQFILLLVDIKNGEEPPSFHDIRDAKSNLHFYDSVTKLIKQNNKRFTNNLLPRNSKVSSSFFSSGTISSKTQVNREYLKKGYFCITDWKDEEIGDKLASVTKSLLNKITPKEIYRGVFLKKDKDITSPNVVNCINNFNKLTSFIIEDVLSYNTPRDRAKIYEKWVKIADYCKRKKNYNDCIAIYSALNNYIITGLKLTLKALSSSTKNLFQQISDFCSCEGNYKKVREDMNLCEQKGETFIPYLGMLLRDINFYEESMKYINENGYINMEKIENINTIMEKYFRYKTNEKISNKNYKNIPELKFLEHLEQNSEEDLEKIANDLEPIYLMGTQRFKRATNIDKRFFEKYIDNKYKKRGTITPNMRNTLVPGRTQSYMPSAFYQ